VTGGEQMEYLLQVEDLVTKFFTDDGVVTAVDHVSFSVRPGEVVGIVGESGCGKSVAALSILRLVQYPPGKIVGGRILFDGRDLLTLNDRDMRAIRGNDVAMIFQEPMTSLNPVYTIGDQIGEAIELHQGLDKGQARIKTIEMLKLVGIPRPEAVVDEYPHRFSGGMRQRAMIAMALSCNPKLLIADEPTTALDVTIQAQILELMKDLKHRINTAIMFITHDLGVIAEMAQYVVVMYAGKVVESTDVVTLFREPKHPYTVGLFRSKPRIEDERDTLDYIPGAVPNPLRMPPGCPFHPRCGSAMDICRITEPPEVTLKRGHFIRCWLYENSRDMGAPGQEDRDDRN
jgi:peptide/nickel transport system ATP-binding protein